MAHKDYYERDHEEEVELPLKLIKVDKDIVPVVRWLNSHPEVFTLYSCQGTKDEHPYVLFLCSDEESLRSIGRVVHWPVADLVMDFYYGTNVRYNLRIAKGQLDQFCYLCLPKEFAVRQGRYAEGGEFFKEKE